MVGVISRELEDKAEAAALAAAAEAASPVALRRSSSSSRGMKLPKPDNWVTGGSRRLLSNGRRESCSEVDVCLVEG